MPKTTVLKVLLHCDGCVSKVKRHIRRLEGVESFHVDQKHSKVTVYGTVKPQVVLDRCCGRARPQNFGLNRWSEMKLPAAEEVVGGKKKAADGSDNGSAKKQKSGKTTESKESIELVEFDDGDGEIVNETDLPSVEIADESDTMGLMDKMPATPAKKGRNRKG